MQLISKVSSMAQEVTMTGKQSLKKILGLTVSIGLLSTTLMAETSAASRYDNQVQTAVTQKQASKNQ